MLIEPLNGDFESVQSLCNNILIARKLSPVTLHLPNLDPPFNK